jgi:hypothetical protein
VARRSPGDNDEMPHVFISYVHENAELVDRLATELRSRGVDVWLDRQSIRPGERWRTAITRAIREGACFIACFSTEYAARGRTFMNEELTLAIEELRQRPHDRSWFIPVVLDGARVPDRPIGGGETLEDLQWVDLAKWNDAVEQITAAISISARHTENMGRSALLEARHLLREHLVAFDNAAKPEPPPTDAQLRENAKRRVSVTYVEPSEAEEDEDVGVGVHPGSLLGERLRAYGYDVWLSYWSEAFLLAKLPPETEDTAYIIHRDNLELAARLCDIVAALQFVPRIIVLTTEEAAEHSANVGEREMLEYVNAMVALRVTA